MRQESIRLKAKQLRAEVNYYWSLLTVDDLTDFAGERDKLARLLQRRYGFAESRAEREAQWFLQQVEDRLRRAAS
jgi:hypothetical protein